MKKFPSIGQFRNVVKEVRLNHDYKDKDAQGSPIYKHESPYPVIPYIGTVKLHGTNAAVVKYKDGRIDYQSRGRVLSLQHDNSGFMLFMKNVSLDCIFDQYEFNDYIAIYGEWCGKGIQKGVAISELPRMFVVFGVKVDDVWMDTLPSSVNTTKNIYIIDRFPTYTIDIDFNYPELSQNKLGDFTKLVEEECPVGKYFGVSGVGEGIVWSAFWNNKAFRFKVKGEKHSVSKVKTLASVDIEMINSINEFVDLAVTQNRLEQGIHFLTENGKAITQKSTGDFLRWVVNDVIKEETDTIVSNKLDYKQINPTISRKAKEWYFKYLDNKTMQEK